MQNEVNKNLKKKQKPSYFVQLHTAAGDAPTHKFQPEAFTLPATK